MLEVFGQTQQKLLKEIYKSHTGLTVDELSDRLDVTRTAVNQHLHALMNDGFIAKGDLRITLGRPGRRFLLTQKGHDVFPKQYSWFSDMMLRSIKEEQGSEGLSQFMRSTAKMIAKGLGSPDDKQKTYSQKVQALAKVMNQLSYDAELKTLPGKKFEIEATNCVYHSLAKAYPEVCDFDRELMTTTTGSVVEQKQCMARGDRSCCFHLREKFKHV